MTFAYLAVRGCAYSSTGRFLAECEYVGLDAGCEEAYLKGAIIN
jgi:hypothetical protein